MLQISGLKCLTCSYDFSGWSISAKKGKCVDSIVKIQNIISQSYKMAFLSHEKDAIPADFIQHQVQGGSCSWFFLWSLAYG